MTISPMLTSFSYVSLGFSEIDFATCYLAQVLISPNGDVINQRRKIKPSHVEKLIYGDGAGDTFMSVTDTDVSCIPQSMLPHWSSFSYSISKKQC